MQIHWKDVAHYGVAAIALILAGLAEVGIQIPGVTIDPAIAGAFGIGVLGAGFKGGIKVKAAIALLAIGLSMASAWAGDIVIPVKAPRAAASNPFLSPSASGWYLGLGSTASVAQSSVSGNNVFASSLVTGNLNAAGGTFDVVAGYIWSTPKFWSRFEADGSYMNITASNSTGGGATLAERWAASQEFDLGWNFFEQVLSPVLSAIGSNLSIPSFTPTLPSNIAVVNTPQQYVGVGVRESGVSGTIGVASGTEWNIAPMVKSGYIWETTTNGKPNGGAIDIFAWVAWPTKGFDLQNVFASNGAPLTTGAAINVGTEYGIGLHVLFGI